MSDAPTKIGKYEILEIAGQGNMGTVYAARDPFSGEKVAIKVCPIESNASEQTRRLARKIFFNEAHAAGALHHPNVLTIFDAGEQDGQPYIVMEYVEGGETLKPYVDPENFLPMRRIVEILYQCAKALDYAHRRGVIHRDIKPTNIMLTGEGEVKIGDFGIAVNALSDSTQVMGLLGSPRYMSPEQARDEEMTNKTDLYSLGVVAYELLTGRPPFMAKGITQLVTKILNEVPRPPSEFRGDAPKDLDAIVARAMSKDPNDRYGSGQAMASDLAAAFGHLEPRRRELSDDDKFQLLRRLRFFNDFADAEIREVVKASRWRRFAPGHHVIDEGTLEQAFYIIVTGEVSVRIGEREITILGGGDCFGEMGYLAKTRRTASIVARDDLVLVKIDATLMEQTSVTCQLRFTQIFLSTLIERLARTSGRLAENLE